MRTAGPKYGSTLVELLSVLGIISGLAALILPAIQAAREASRRSACQNNLRQVGLALTSFEAQFRRYPIGAKSNISWPTGLTTIGTSWWTQILPELEESDLAARLDTRGPYAGWTVLHPQNGRLVDGVTIGAMYCPSTPLPQLYSVGGFRVGMPSYAGISGAANDQDFKEPRVSVCCSPKVDGEISNGGMLSVNMFVKLNEVPDGASHTLLVGEISDYAYSRKGVAYRIDGGFPNGWLAGTVSQGTPPALDPTRTPAVYNVVTVRYPINTRDYDLPGILDDHGPNNPLRSAHPGGAVTLFVDGSVHLLADDVEVLTLKRLATRDDVHGTVEY